MPLKESKWVDVLSKQFIPSHDLNVNDDLINDLVGYDPEKIEEVPLIYDHQDWSGDALGWVLQARRVGDVMQVKFRDVQDEVIDKVASGRRKYISIGFTMKHPVTNKPYLMHVGLLGAANPAAKGLKPVQFSGEAGGVGPAYAFQDKEQGVTLVVTPITKETFMDPTTTPGGATGGDGDVRLSREEHERLQTLANKGNALEGQLAETKRQNDELAKRVALVETRARQTENNVALTQLVRDGYMLPAQRRYADAILNYRGGDVVTLSANEDEGAKEEKISLRDAVTRLIQAGGKKELLDEKLKGGDVQTLSSYDDCAQKAAEHANKLLTEKKITQEEWSQAMNREFTRLVATVKGSDAQ